MKIYFASDFHLGIPDHDSSLKREKLLVSWLSMVEQDADELYLMGDIFDFWFEYKTVIPRGFARLFGKLAEITDKGIPVYLFRGNHDIWAFDYLNKELGIKLHREYIIREWNGKKFFLSHGDGLGPGDNGYKFLKKIFEFKPNQWLFRWLHPDIGTRLALYFSRRSRYANILKDKKLLEQVGKIDLSTERLYDFAKKYSQERPEIDYYIFGHRHYPGHMPLPSGKFYVNLGDWISNYSYALADENGLSLFTYKNGNPALLEGPF
ncbi:MAG: UDP-2,3-diacylglucosamine diphosphatase [Chloroflexota bacterium]|nr:UDP-2,3-diacylglucosamine diphosphatase [Lentimicrobium sp.]